MERSAAPLREPLLAAPAAAPTPRLLSPLLCCAWLVYGTLLHLHRLGRWPQRRLAAWSLAAFLLLAVSYRGLVLFPSWSTYHIFDMDLRMHLTGSEPAAPEEPR